MHLLRPEASWLLLLAAIPVILYLLPLPRRRQTIPSTLLWRMVVERQGLVARRSVTRVVLTIVVSVLILLLIIGAVARVIAGGRTDTPEGTLVVFVLDNSASMQLLDGDVSRFERARRRATGLLETLRADTRLALVTTAPQAQFVVRPTTHAADVNDALRQLTPSDDAADLSHTLDWLGRAFANDALSVHVFSDTPISATALSVTPHIFGRSVPNAGIVAFGARRIDVPRRAVLVQARIGNFSDAERAVTLLLQHDDASGAERSVDLAPDAVTTVSWTIPSVDVARVALEMTPADAFVLDDHASADLAPFERKRVILVAEKTPAHLLAALRADSSLKLFLTTPANYRPETPADLTILYRCSAPVGATTPRLLVAPPSGPTPEENAVPVALGTGHPILRGIAWRADLVREATPMPFYETAGTTPRTVTVAFDPETEPIARTRTMPMLVRNITEYLAPRAAGTSAETTGLLDAAESDLRVGDEGDAERDAAAAAASPVLLWTLMIVAAAALVTLETVLYHRRILE